MRATPEPFEQPLVLPPKPEPTPAPASPDPVKAFELGNWAATLPDGLAEKPASPSPAPVHSDPLDVRNGSWKP